MANVPLESETHGGEDVQVFASGPMSHLFTGVFEESFLAHGMAYAACVGSDRRHCRGEAMNTADNLHISPIVLVMVLLPLMY